MTINITSIIKKYWKHYLERLWYLAITYFAMTIVGGIIEDEFDFFQPFGIVTYVIYAGIWVWWDEGRDKKKKKNKQKQQ